MLNLIFNQGEIDIVEGVNDQSPNAATLHTNAGWSPSGSVFHPPALRLKLLTGCTMPASRAQTG